jgi:hypothetical protein
VQLIRRCESERRSKERSHIHDGDFHHRV